MVKTIPAVPLEKVRRIANHLLAKTKAGQVNWVRKDTSSDVPQTRYELVLPDSRVAVTYTIPRARPDVVSLQFINPNGVTIDSWAVEEPDYDPEHEPIEQVDPDGDWRLLFGLFSEVHRLLTGWDKVISDIEKALASQGPIGKPFTP